MITGLLEIWGFLNSRIEIHSVAIHRRLLNPAETGEARQNDSRVHPSGGSAMRARSLTIIRIFFTDFLKFNGLSKFPRLFSSQGGGGELAEGKRVSFDCPNILRLFLRIS